jgi:hypothetical protein
VSIPLVRDSSTAAHDYEHCCFCFKPARHWYVPKDVAVCEECASSRSASEVPTKALWCAEVIKRYPHLNTSRFRQEIDV